MRGPACRTRRMGRRAQVGALQPRERAKTSGNSHCTPTPLSEAQRAFGEKLLA